MQCGKIFAYRTQKCSSEAWFEFKYHLWLTQYFATADLHWVWFSTNGEEFFFVNFKNSNLTTYRNTYIGYCSIAQ